MLAKKHRFYGQGAIRYINRKGTSVRASIFTIKYVPNKRPNSYRVAVVVSKKVTKSAPKRNRIRRRIYEIIRTQATSYINGYDVVIIVFNDRPVAMPHDELSESIREVLSQVQPTS